MIDAYVAEHLAVVCQRIAQAKDVSPAMQYRLEGMLRLLIAEQRCDIAEIERFLQEYEIGERLQLSQDSAGELRIICLQNRAPVWPSS